MVNIQHKRGTRASLDNLASTGRLAVGQIYLIIDENRIAIATSDSTYQATLNEGEVSSGGGTISNDLPVPDLFDENDPNFFYFGWENVNGGWLVQRQNRSTSITESATTGHTNLTDAFADRINLGYA